MLTEKNARVMLGISPSESVKKRWLTVESYSSNFEAMEAVHSLILRKSAHSFIKGSWTFSGLARVSVLSCVWFCPSALRKASGRGRGGAGAGTQPVNPSVEAWPR